MTSSVDPDAEIDLILARLQALGEECEEGYPQGYEHPVDAFGAKLPYREFEAGSVVPSATQRLLAAGEQAQPHVWAFQVHHVAPKKRDARKLAQETDKSLIGWSPSPASGPISMFYFTTYDEFDKNGEHLQWVVTRFYQATLGQQPDL